MSEGTVSGHVDPPDHLTPDRRIETGQTVDDQVAINEAVSDNIIDDVSHQTTSETRLDEPPSNNQNQDLSEDSSQWSSLAYELDLQGLSQQIAVNSLLEKSDDNHYCLVAPPELLDVISDTITDEITVSLCKACQLEIQLQFRPRGSEPGETPQQTKTRCIEERRQQAITDIRNDPLVKKLQRLVGAELIESSVQKLDN